MLSSEHAPPPVCGSEEATISNVSRARRELRSDTAAVCKVHEMPPPARCNAAPLPEAPGRTAERILGNAPDAIGTHGTDLPEEFEVTHLLGFRQD